LIQFNKPWARLDGLFSPNAARVVKLQRDDHQLVKQFVLAGKVYKRLSLEQSLPAVIFEPGHLQLLARGPDYRREFLDDLLARSQVGFKRVVNSYRRALTQRNALLKRPKNQAAAQLFAWDVRLSDLAGQIVSARLGLVEQINKTISKTYSQIAGRRASVRLDYQNQFGPEHYSSRMLAKLETSAELDFRRGFTGLGPHREDFTVYLNKQPALSSASRGETRSLVVALKIYELGLIKKARQATPIFLLDDVFSELDSARRRALVDHLKGQQTIITTTDADAVIEYFTGEHRLIALNRG